ncbi:hypothetical protein DFH27DRAFT_609698 [Peziza echinospora]|nr:hypothetical protein DFH27DRAFT_609698 [Peziza echinospora]
MLIWKAVCELSCALCDLEDLMPKGGSATNEYLTMAHQAKNEVQRLLVIARRFEAEMEDNLQEMNSSEGEDLLKYTGAFNQARLNAKAFILKGENAVSRCHTYLAKAEKEFNLQEAAKKKEFVSNAALVRRHSL